MLIGKRKSTFYRLHSGSDISGIQVESESHFEFSVHLFIYVPFSFAIFFLPSFIHSVYFFFFSSLPFFFYLFLSLFSPVFNFIPLLFYFSSLHISFSYFLFSHSPSFPFSSLFSSSYFYLPSLLFLPFSSSSFSFH